MKIPASAAHMHYQPITNERQSRKISQVHKKSRSSSLLTHLTTRISLILAARRPSLRCHCPPFHFMLILPQALTSALVAHIFQHVCSSSQWHRIHDALWSMLLKDPIRALRGHFAVTFGTHGLVWFFVAHIAHVVRRSGALPSEILNKVYLNS